jgi:hypothetical protein
MLLMRELLAPSAMGSRVLHQPPLLHSMLDTVETVLLVRTLRPISHFSAVQIHRSVFCGQG